MKLNKMEVDLLATAGIRVLFFLPVSQQEAMNNNENIKQVFLVTDTVVCRKCEELGESLFEILLYVSLLIIYCLPAASQY